MTSLTFTTLRVNSADDKLMTFSCIFFFFFFFLGLGACVCVLGGGGGGRDGGMVIENRI